MKTEVVQATWALPRFLDCGKADDLYLILASQPELLYVDMTKCEWLEHFELQKLATHLIASRATLEQLVLRVPSFVDPAARRIAGATVYAASVGFFAYLASEFGEDLFIEKNVASPSRFDTDVFAAYVASLREQLSSSGKSAGGYPSTSLTIRSIIDWRSVDDITERFSTGQQLQDVLDSTLDVITSGEFATLIVNEVAENVVEHAFINNTPGAAAISVTTIQFGDRDEQDSRINTRLRVAPEYEKTFLREPRSAIGYLELVLSDTGVGIVNTLRTRPDLYETWLEHRNKPTDEELLAAAFERHVTRDPGPHRPGHRGLFYVAECVTEYGGTLVCETSNLRLVITPQTGTPRPSDVSSSKQGVRGTHIRILLPIEATRKPRNEWSPLALTAPSLMQSAAITETPVVRGLPGATPLRDPERREALVAFGRSCCEAITARPPTTQMQEIVWLSAAHTRRWRKQHIQLFLDELRRHEAQSAVVIVNMPETVAKPMEFIARHLLTSNDSQVIILVDENARRAVVSQQLAATRRDFEQWTKKRDGYLTEDFTAAGRMLSVVASRFRTSVRDLSFDDVCFLASRVGVDTEFGHLLGNITIDADTRMRGYVELDDATRHSAYTRTLGACIAVTVRKAFKADGIIAMSRPAARLLEHNGIAAWSMDTPHDALPPPKWWFRHKRVCLVTDIVTRGQAAAAVLRNMRNKIRNIAEHVTIAGVIAPIIAEAHPPLRGKLFTRDAPAPRVAWLDAGDGVPVPLLWIHKRAAYEQDATIDPQRAEERFNLVPREVESLDAGYADISVPGFIRAIEQRDALWFGHVEITGTHFDVEVDLTRLFIGSQALAEFATLIAEHIIVKRVDLILYPDDSRIQLAVAAAIDDALATRNTLLPPLVRAHRDVSNDLFLTPRDAADMRRARSILIIDDAINSGHTIKELLRLVSLTAPNASSVTVYPFMSREPTRERRLLRAIPPVGGALVEWHDFVRYPVGFWSAEECPQCQRARFARTASIIGSPLVQRSLRNFAKRVRPAVYGSDREPEASRGRGAVKIVLKGGGTEHFGTLAGACAALAAEIAVHLAEPDILGALLRSNQYPPDLAAFAIYMVGSRVGIHSSIWYDDNFLDLYATTARSLALVRQQEPEDAGHADPLFLLSLAAWFAPADVLPTLFARLMQALVPLLEHNVYFEEALVLALRLADIQLSNAAKNEIRQALNPKVHYATLQRLHRRSENPPTIAFMRLRHISQVVFHEAVMQPWVEGVAHVLPILSYKAGHPRVGMIDPASRSAARAALSAAKAAAQQLTGEAKDASVREFFEHSRALLAAPTTQLEFLETMLASALGPWFQALKFQKEWASARSPDELIAELRIIEKRITWLRRFIGRAERAVGSGDLERSAAEIAEIAKLQEELIGGLFDDQPGSVRHVVERYLTPLTPILQRHARGEIREQLDQNLRVELEGSFFDAADAALADGGVPRVVVIAPPETIEDILENVIVRNPAKHVAPRYPNRPIRVQAQLHGLTEEAPALTIAIRVLVDDQPVPLGEAILTKTLGNRQKLLKVCGGDIEVTPDADGRLVELSVSLVAGLY
jgi:adenine/guanine phosphoribosyltransferase-like PRPP-binding protein